MRSYEEIVTRNGIQVKLWAIVAGENKILHNTATGDYVIKAYSDASPKLTDWEEILISDMPKSENDYIAEIEAIGYEESYTMIEKLHAIEEIVRTNPELKMTNYTEIWQRIKDIIG